VEGGVWATSGGGWLALRPAEVPPLAPRALQVPGRTELPEVGLELRVELPWGPRPASLPGQPQLDVVEPAPALTQVPAPDGSDVPVPPGARAYAVGGWVALPGEVLGGLTVRPRRPGDRLALAHGTRKLQDLFTDHGVPRAIRDLVPVLVDADDQPLWVPGVAVRAFPSDRRAAARIRLARTAAHGPG
jgi:tRNA(Ile)-lysidine synthetase-like protein